MRYVIWLMFLFLQGCTVNRHYPTWQFTKTNDLVETGQALTRHFLQTPHTNFGGPGKNPGWVTYPDVCTWFGALRFARAIGDSSLLKGLESRYFKLLREERELLPRPNHVDNNVFGILPLALYQLTGNPEYRETGLAYADKQWSLPVGAGKRQEALFREGYSWQTRFWIDDMYMITAIQSQAYEVTGDRKYINRAAREMVAYLDSLQRPNGLFYHAPEAPFFWGRGNGWMAAGMTELLRYLPKENPHRERIMRSFTKMMQTLKGLQAEEGLWRQLLDYENAWIETSGSAMFLYAMITGVSKGWLSAVEFTPVIRKAWPALKRYMNEQGDLTDVCEGTNIKNDVNHYLQRKRITGDLHGQAPLLWICYALCEASDN